MKFWNHELKIIRPYFSDVFFEKCKKFEVRRNDRGGFFQGQLILFRELIPEGEGQISSNTFSGLKGLAEIEYVLPEDRGTEFGVQKGFVVFGIKPLIMVGRIEGEEE